MSAGLYLPALTDGELLRHYEDPHTARQIADRLVEAEERIEELDEEIDIAESLMLSVLPGDVLGLSFLGLVYRLIDMIEEDDDEEPKP